MTTRRSKAAIREDILTALSGMDGDPETLVDIEAATEYMYEDQDTNAPDEFWTVLRTFRRRNDRVTCKCGATTYEGHVRAVEVWYPGHTYRGFGPLPQEKGESK
jgi:hypothetical protein